LRYATQLILDQSRSLAKREPGITRLINTRLHVESRQISVITGIRRSGKSTFMLQLASLFQDYYYLSFDDERLIHFTVEDFNALMIAFKAIKEANVIVLDEIQLVPGWERFVRRIFDEGYKVILSGSNATLLGSELATHLTGRYILTEMFPFSFPEYLSFLKVETKNLSSSKIAQVRLAFDKYLEGGGFSEYIKCGEVEVLKRTYDDILYRDLVSRYGIRNISNFRNLSQYLFTNFTSELVYLSLGELLGFSSTTTVRDYIHYIAQAYLVFESNRFDFSLKRQYSTSRKVYVIDNGLRNIIAFRISSDQGQLLENLVYIELRRRGHEVWYYRTKQSLETDFLINPRQPELIQVCYDMSQPHTRKREFQSLLSSMEELKISEALILTNSEEETVVDAGKTIQVLPAWKWLL